MSNLTVVAAFFSFMTVLAMFAGAQILVIPGFAITLVLAILGAVKAEKAVERNSRTLSAFAVVIALLPFFKPLMERMALRRAERLRAATTAPLYGRLDADVAAYSADLQAARTRYGQFPAFSNGSLMPLIGRDGRVVKVDPSIAKPPPTDPFDTARSLNIQPIADWGALLISVGQDAVGEWPLPKDMLCMDGQPNEPLAPLAWTGVDLRTSTYDPTNGALGIGDVVRWEPGSAKKMDDALQPLWKAWEKVDAITPPAPAGAEIATTLPEDDAKTAAKLLDDKEYLGAIAAASRAIRNRRPHPNFWTTPELKRAEFTRARALYELGHYRTAADFLIDYTSTSPNDGEGQYYLGICLYLGLRHDDAKRHFAAAFQIDPQGPFAKPAAEAFDAIEARKTPVFARPFVVEEARKPKEALQARSNQSSTNAPGS